MTQEPGANTGQLTRSFSSAFLSISYKKQLIFYVEERKSNIRIKYLNLDKKKKFERSYLFFSVTVANAELFVYKHLLCTGNEQGVELNI